MNHCGATTRAGGTCRNPAGKGTDHLGHGRCKNHGGSTPNHRKAGRTAKARDAVATYGLPVEVDPHDALIEEIARTNGHVLWLGDIIADLERGSLIWGITQEKTGGEDWGTTHKAAPNVWLELYHRERQHLARVSKAAIDAGIDERRVRLAEDQGQAIVAVLRATLEDLGVDVTPEVASTVGRHLRAIDGGKAA